MNGGRKHQHRLVTFSARSRTFQWALKADLIKTDPTNGVERPRPKKGGGFIAWTEDDVSAYEQMWPIGTRQRVWLDVLLYTGLRRGDAVVIGRQHVRDGIAVLRTEKSQGEITVTLPIPVLQRTLDAGPTGELAFICGANGKPFTKDIRQRISRSLPRCQCAWIGAWRAQDCSDQGS